LRTNGNQASYLEQFKDILHYAKTINRRDAETQGAFPLRLRVSAVMCILYWPSALGLKP